MLTPPGAKSINYTSYVSLDKFYIIFMPIIS